MKINKLIIKILILYVFVFFTLLGAFFCLMPFSFDEHLIIFLFNFLITTFVLLVSLFLVFKNSNKKNILQNNCDTIYFVCKNIPFIIYLLHIIIAVINSIIFKEIILYSLYVFAYNIFYIFSKNYFMQIINYSENNLRPHTVSILPKKNNFILNIPYEANLIFEFLPIIVVPLIIYLSFSIINISFIILLIGIALISIISVIYICLEIRTNINNIVSKENNNFNYEFSDLIFNINATKQIYNDYIDNLHITQNKELEKEHISSIEILRRTVDAKDTYTRGHSDRVSSYCVLIGEKMNLPKEDIDLLRIGGLFHDIGKIGIPDSILLKEGKLTDDEYNKIKKHPVIGAEILKGSTIFENIIPIVLHHHEKFDGTGYPSNLKGNDIPLLARIVAVADTFDAMTSKRSYRNALPLDVVISEFKRCSETQFDANIANIFLDILDNEYDKIENIKNKL